MEFTEEQKRFIKQMAKELKMSYKTAAESMEILVKEGLCVWLFNEYIVTEELLMKKRDEIIKENGWDRGDNRWKN